MSDALEIKMTCDWCGEEFAPTPESFVETGFSAVEYDEPDEADAWKGNVEALEPVELNLKPADVTDATIRTMKAQMGLNDEQIKELLATGNVTSGFSCLCDKCLNPDQ